MNREQILNEFTAKIKDFEQLAYNIAGAQDKDDLFQECTLMLLEFPEERLISYYNPTQGLKPFFIRMLMLQHRSKTSYFHQKYRKQEQFLNDKSEEINHYYDAINLDELDNITELETAAANAYKAGKKEESIFYNGLKQSDVSRFGNVLPKYFERITNKGMKITGVNDLYSDFLKFAGMAPEDYKREKFISGLRHIAGVKGYKKYERKEGGGDAWLIRFYYPVL